MRRASETRQGTKAREVGLGQCRQRYGDFRGMARLVAARQGELRSPEEGPVAMALVSAGRERAGAR